MRFVFIGFGFRAATIHRVARALPGFECAGAIVRTARPLPVPKLEDLREARPDFVISAVSPAAATAAISAAVDLGLPVLAETPAPADLARTDLARTDLARTDLVQIAEQYPLMPSHAARLAAVRSGVIGTPTQVQISSTQEHHAAALIRAYLGTGHTPAAVHVTRTVAPLVSPLDRGGWTDDPTPKPATTTIATLDFGDGRSAVYDFTDGQTRNLLRTRRLLVRATHGELHDDQVTHMPAPRTITRTPLVRRQTGHDLDMGGFDTETITLGSEVLYRNPYVGHRFNDDEIAIATLLDAMAAWVRGDGPPPYPLAEGLRDRSLLAGER